MPCYGKEKQVNIATQKDMFKKMCKDSGVPVIPGITAQNYTEVYDFASQVAFPILLKPVDNSGSRGVIKCNSLLELQKAYQYAISFSQKRKVIVEKYLEYDSIAISYFASNGSIRLSTTNDRWIYKSAQSGSSITSYSEYPSMYTNRYVSEVNDRVIKMLRDNGFENGMISLQAFVGKDKFYFCEMCFRPSGGQHYIFTLEQHGIDQMALLIEYALTGDCYGSWDFKSESPFFSENYVMLRILGIPGQIVYKMSGFKKISKSERVLSAKAVLNIGSIIGEAGTTAQVVGNIIYRLKKEENAFNIAQELFNQLQIENKEGKQIAFFTFKL